MHLLRTKAFEMRLSTVYSRPYPDENFCFLRRYSWVVMFTFADFFDIAYSSQFYPFNLRLSEDQVTRTIIFMYIVEFQS